MSKNVDAILPAHLYPPSGLSPLRLTIIKVMVSGSRCSCASLADCYSASYADDAGHWKQRFGTRWLGIERSWFIYYYVVIAFCRTRRLQSIPSRNDTRWSPHSFHFSARRILWTSSDWYRFWLLMPWRPRRETATLPLWSVRGIVLDRCCWRLRVFEGWPKCYSHTIIPSHHPTIASILWSLSWLDSILWFGRGRWFSMASKRSNIGNHYSGECCDSWLELDAHVMCISARSKLSALLSLLLNSMVIGHRLYYLNPTLLLQKLMCPWAHHRHIQEQTFPNTLYPVVLSQYVRLSQVDL